MNSLRILVVLPMYGGSLPVGRYCAKALMNSGYSVRVFDAPLIYPAYTGFQKLDLAPSRIGALENAFLRLVAQAIWSQAQEFEPDLVLALAQAPMDRNLLHRLRQAGMRTVMWFVEDYRLFTYWQAYASLYDAFAVIQKEPFIGKLHEIGQTHALYLPLAALPSFHAPVTLSQKELDEFGSDISFLGAGYPNRRKTFRMLADHDFKIWGSDWDGEEALRGNIQRNGERVSEEDSVRIYNAAKININLHSSVDMSRLIGKGDFVNPRTFELAAMGAFQLVDRRSLMDDLFAPDELAVFRDMDELREKIDYFLAHPEERRKYAEKARARVLKEHTYEKRMRTLVEYMEKEFGPWKKRSEDVKGALSDVPEEMREKIAQVAARLGLSPNSPFSDIVERLRQQQGPLDELEVAILFLDEWKKQYQGR